MVAEVNTTPRQLTEAKRIATIEFLRGIAIIFMIFIHSLYKIYDYQWIVENPEQLTLLPAPLLVLIGILAYFGLWIFFFVLLSGIVNAYVMTRKILRVKEKKTILYKQLLTGFIIVLVGKIKEGFIGYWGYFGQALRSGDWSNIYPIKNMFFEMKALDIIGWCYIITGLLMYLLLKDDPYKHYTRNVIIFLGLIIVILILTPIVSNYAKSLNWFIPPLSSIPPTDENRLFNGWPSVHVATANPSLKTALLVFLVGANDPILPYLAASFVGAIIGMSLAQETIPRHFLKYSFLSSLLCFATGIVMIVFHIATDFPASVFNKPPDLPMFLIHLGGQIAVIMGFLSLIEFKRKANYFARSFIFRFVRRWSVVSLTVFVLELYELLVKWLLTLIVSPFYPIDFTKHGIFTGLSGFLPSFLVSLFVVIMYDILIRLWEKIDYHGTIEWLIIKIQYLLTKQYSAKLTVNYKNIRWINFQLVPVK